MKATIALTRYGETTELVAETLESLAALEGSGFSVLVSDQRPDGRLLDVAKTLNSDRLPIVYESIDARSLSFARNRAIEAATTDILFFVDPDLIVARDWGERMRATFDEEPDAAIVGSRILPRWRADPPWLAQHGFVQDQYSLLDLGDERIDFHRVVGAAFGIHRRRLGDAARFDENLGRRDGRLFGGEESDLCQRAIGAGHRVVYEGKAVSWHQILPERASTVWILKRFYYAGFGRAMIGGAPRPSATPGGRALHAVLSVMPFYAAGYAKGRITRAIGPRENG